MSSKPLLIAEKSLLQEGPKFNITLTFPSIIDYITATKHICNSLGENTPSIKSDCVEYYTKVKKVLTSYSNKTKSPKSKITKEEREALHNLKKDNNCISLLQIMV